MHASAGENGYFLVWIHTNTQDHEEALGPREEGLIRTASVLQIGAYTGQDPAGGIPDPVGLSGIRLEANLHVISACESALGNLEKCCHRAGLSVSDIVASGLSSAEAVVEPVPRASESV